MNGKKINGFKLFSIFITTTLIFLIGIFFGTKINDHQLDRMVDFQQDLRTQTLSLDLQYALASQDICMSTGWGVMGNELFEMGENLARMENTLGKLNKDVLKLKKYYSLLEIKHWLFLKSVNEECANYNAPVVLYFYSNLDDCKDCEKQGYVLTYLKKKSPLLSIFSFDVNIDNVVLNGLKKKYKINNADLPIVVVNDKTFEGFTELEVLEDAM